MNNNEDYVVLNVKNLKKHFKIGSGSNGVVLKAVDDISFSIRKGEVFGLVGESGCGKTTTGRTIIRLYSPSDGTIEFTSKENGELKTTIIGAGFDSHIENIRRAKREYYFNSLEFRPYHKEKHDLSNKHKERLGQLDLEIKETEKEKKRVYDDRIKKISHFKESLYQINHEYILNKEDIKFEGISSILKMNYAEDEKDIIKTLKYRLKFLKNNFNEKKSGILDSSAISREEQLSEINDLKDEYFKKKIDIENQLTNQLKNKQMSSSNQNTKEAVKNIKEDTKNKINALNIEYNKNIYDLYKDLYVDLFDNEEVSYTKIKFKVKLQFLKLKNIKDSELKKISRELNRIKLSRIKCKISYSLGLVGLLFRRIIKIKDYKNDSENLSKLKMILKEKVVFEKEKIMFAKNENDFKNIGKVVNNVQMIFQDPIESLNPRMTVREIISEGLIIQGVKDKKYIDDKVKEMMSLVGLSEDYLYRYPHEFSGGQRQRIGIARALIVEPELIIADEPVSALDVSIQAQVINLLGELRKKLGLTILFIAHDLSVVKYFCDRIAVMYNGKIVETSSSDELFENPVHPYTKALISAIPQPDPKAERVRKRIIYNPLSHNYISDRPFIFEIRKEHFIYANKEEIEAYKKEMGGRK
ncbi:MAG: ATP-binding cassette domain-containing protein [Acholeplasma sp.]|nr:ATP-binding cassette domain-containing protein [Acholeplasma sp.]